MKLDALKTIESALNDAIMAEEAKVEAKREYLLGLSIECAREQNEADNRIAELRAALKEFTSISWRE